MVTGEYVSIDGRDVLLEGEKNLLELARKAGIDIPTFCYHSELSVYGACRLCAATKWQTDEHGPRSLPTELRDAGCKIRNAGLNACFPDTP